TLRQQFKLKAVEDRISRFTQSDVSRSHTGKNRPERLGPHSGTIYFRLHLSQQNSPCRLQRLIRDTGQRIVVVSRLAPIDVPVCERHGMRFRSCRNSVEECSQSILRIDMAEVSAVGTQLSK